MRLRDTIIRVVCSVLAASLLVIAGMQLDFINSQRKEMRLIVNEPLENAPPSLAFATVAMGAFRGLVVDVLWMRADKLKDENQFFDAKQLAEWITTLQPRFASVWEFHAWNMAYNISVAIPATEPEERWRWVKNGYELLRDKGIPLNPKSITLYRELARIFQHKIGSVSDDVHKYYKLQLALAMKPLLGPADNESFEALAKAPTHWQQIIADANVIPLISALESADKVFSDKDKFVSNYLSLRQNPKRFEPAAFKTIDDFRGSEALNKFDVFAKAYQLRNVWKLDPVLMQQLNKTYGPIDYSADPNTHLPLDWRHPNSHAIYWAIKGLQTAGKKEFSMDETNTDRMVGHSLQNLFRNGRIFIYEGTSVLQARSAAQSQVPTKEVFLRPDLRMFEPYNKSMLAVLAKYDYLKKEGTYESLQTGHRNMLSNAVLLFYQAGQQQQAQRIYDQLRNLYQHKREDLRVSLVVFARNRLRDELQNIGVTDAKEMVVALLHEAYFRYALRDDDEAFGREKMAKEVYDDYQSRYADEDRIDLPPFALLRYFALLDFVYNEQYSPSLRESLLKRIEIERPDLFEKLQRQEKSLMKRLEQS